MMTGKTHMFYSKTTPILNNGNKTETRDSVFLKQGENARPQCQGLNHSVISRYLGSIMNLYPPTQIFIAVFFTHYHYSHTVFS